MGPYSNTNEGKAMTDRFFARLAIGCAVASMTLAASAADTPAVKPAAAASAPAAAAAPAPAPAPAAAAAATTAPAPASAASDVEAAVRAWASAWSAKDVDRYLGAYAKDFKPSGKKLTAKAWADQRRKRIANKDSISVSVDELVVSVRGNTATARFKQTYKGGKVSETAPKTLELKRVGTQWLIQKERAGS